MYCFQVHCSEEALKTYKFMAFVGLARPDYAKKTFVAKPLLWSNSDTPAIEKQFDAMNSVLRRLFGFSDGHMYYDHQFYKRQYNGRTNDKKAKVIDTALPTHL